MMQPLHGGNRVLQCDTQSQSVRCSSSIFEPESLGICWRPRYIIYEYKHKKALSWIGFAVQSMHSVQLYDAVLGSIRRLTTKRCRVMRSKDQ
jgi:hypothetical protein